MVDSNSAIWGYGFGREMAEKEAAEAKRKVKSRDRGFVINSAELKNGLIFVEAVNAYNKPAKVAQVFMREIYPEPKVRKFLGGIISITKGGERLPCEWKVSGFNMVNPGEIIEVIIKPKRLLKEGYGYEITVGMEQESKEMPGFIEYVGTPTVYIYLNGKLKKPSDIGKSVIEEKFCINCGVKIPSSAQYCPICGEKQEP
jgi:ribosomal protein L40E